MTDRKTFVSDEETNLENVECTDQKMELDLDDLDDAAGGEKHSPYQGAPGLVGSQVVYDRMQQMRNHTFRRG